MQDAAKIKIVLPKSKQSSTIYCFKDRGAYTWTIHNFGFAFGSDCNCGNTFSSDTFSFGSNINFDWQIQLFPSIDEANKCIIVKVVSHNKNNYKLVLAECQVSILGKHIEHTVKTVSPHNFTNVDWEEQLVKMDYLMNEENGLLINDRLTLFCQIDVTGHYSIEKKNSVGHEIFINRLQVSKDLQLLMNHNSYDTILTLNNEKYYVHKCILASQSSVFSAMFDHCMQEQINGEVVLTDISTETLKKMIHFMYTGVITNINEISKETLTDLLVAADKYELNELKEICEMLLYNLLNVSNAIEIIILANFYNLQNLKYATIHFMIANIKELTKTPEFESFSKSYSHLLPKFIELVNDGSSPFNSYSLSKSYDCDFEDFHINPPATDFTSVKKNSWSITQIVVHKVSFIWKINNFSYFFNEELPYGPITSNRFDNQTEDWEFWEINLFPRGVDKEAKGYISLYIQFIYFGRKKLHEIKVRYKFFIIDNEGQKRNNFKSTVPIFISSNKKLGVDKFIEKKFLLENKDKLLPNDTLTIMCKIESSRSARVHTNNLNQMHLNILKYQFGISKRQIKLFNSEKFSDLTLIAADQKFLVHQNILSVRSPVFFNTISVQLNKGNTVIEISDVSPAVLKDFLLFIYSGNVENLDVTAKDLYTEAIKYNIENLKAVCETYLCTNLTLENVCDCFTFAHVNMVSKLKSYCLEFIINNIKRVCETSGYNSLADTQPQLLKDIIYKL